MNQQSNPEPCCCDVTVLTTDGAFVSIHMCWLSLNPFDSVRISPEQQGNAFQQKKTKKENMATSCNTMTLEIAGWSCLMGRKRARQPIKAAGLEVGQVRSGPAPEMVHLGCGTAQVGALKNC